MSQCFFHMTSVQIGPVHNKGTDSTTRTHTMNEVQNATQDYDLCNLWLSSSSTLCRHTDSSQSRGWSIRRIDEPRQQLVPKIR
ncbi:hypothetical protein H9L39_06817 [Fusarium oxysporum f. sp. albedinis]|nr:hypothetical protein H9L39_06817 [Fusarium oxysporum f. sp. albedinis]